MKDKHSADNRIETQSKQRVRLDPAVRRRQIVEEATRLIARSGFNGISLADVANACDVRKSTILHYFPSMKALLVGVLLDRDARDFNDEQPSSEQPIGASDALAAVTAKFEENLRHREIIRLFHVLAAEALSPEHPAHDYFRERWQRAKTGLLQILSWKHDPAAAALELLAFWQGLELVWLTDPQADVLSVWHNFANRFFEQ
jgi:AcrR family transcriptional regulator